MATASYITRRDGRYHFQIRFPRHVAELIGRPLYRASLRTSDYRRALLRANECAGWFHRMNDSVDYKSLFEKNSLQLRQYLTDAWPLSDERLFARRNYEELFKNLRRRAEAAGYDVALFAPDCFDLFKLLVEQNVEAEAYLRKRDLERAYERGRADAQASLGADDIPSSFRKAAQAFGSPVGPMPVHHHTREAEAPIAPPAPPTERTGESLPLSVPAGQPAERLPSPAPASPSEKTRLRFSQALDAYVRENEALNGNADSRRDVSLIVLFLIDVMDDPWVDEFGEDKVRALDAMIPDIPDRKGIPGAQCATLATRYAYARSHGWDGLKRLTEARLRNGYHNALSKFFGWLIEQGSYPYPKPVFREVSGENLVSIARDSFNDEEIISIYSQPLFTGCAGDKRIWQPGSYFVQSHIYWAYVLLLLTGLRAGELGQLELDDIQERDGIYYLHLRAFDPSKGRVARKDVKRFKTKASQRIIPLHPLILDLGLLDRIESLRDIDCPVLFPEWQPYPKKGGETRWGQPITKSWQYLKKKIDVDRTDVTLYSTRHWFADLIDSVDIKHATRIRVMGHTNSSDMPGRYGSKRRLTSKDLTQIAEARSPLIEQLSDLLLAAKHKADQGELTVLRPWLQQANWSGYYKEKLLGK